MTHPDIKVEYAYPGNYNKLDKLIKNARGYFVDEFGATGIRQVVLYKDQCVGTLEWAGGLKNKELNRWLGWPGGLCCDQDIPSVQNLNIRLATTPQNQDGWGVIVLTAAMKALHECFDPCPLFAYNNLGTRALNIRDYHKAGWTNISNRDPSHYPTCWVKDLSPDIRRCVATSELKHLISGSSDPAHKRSIPIPSYLLKSMADALRTVPDARASNSRYPLESILGLVFMAVLCGCRDLGKIARFGNRLLDEQAFLLGLQPVGKYERFRIPKYHCFRDLKGKVDMNVACEALELWLNKYGVMLPDLLMPGSELLTETFAQMIHLFHRAD